MDWTFSLQAYRALYFILIESMAYALPEAVTIYKVKFEACRWWKVTPRRSQWLLGDSIAKTDMLLP